MSRERINQGVNTTIIWVWIELLEDKQEAKKIKLFKGSTSLCRKQNWSDSDPALVLIDLV